MVYSFYNKMGGQTMLELLKKLCTVEDRRQEKKVQHKMSDIIAIVLFASLANANEWMEIYYFAKEHEAYLRKYLTLRNGIPSHDTIQRVFAMVSPEFLQQIQTQWNEMLAKGEGEKLRRILAIDGKTQRGTATSKQKANHIVSAVYEDGFCLGQNRVDEKSNEITAIPELLEALNIKGHIITTDAMGTQTEIVKQIRKKHADYVLALKGNQFGMYEDISLYFQDVELLAACAYTSTTEKARGGIEKREYWQTSNIEWLTQRKKWAGLQSIAMTRNTVTKNGITTTEERYFISSLPMDIDLIAKAIRKHWMVESHHWHLDVTFKEDANRTVDKDSAYNLNIIRKISLHILKLLNMSKTNVSLKAKRFMICMNAEKYIDMVLQL